MYICKYLTNNIKIANIAKFSKQCKQTPSNTLEYVLISECTLALCASRNKHDEEHHKGKLSTHPLCEYVIARGFAKVRNKRRSKVILSSYEN